MNEEKFFLKKSKAKADYNSSIILQWNLIRGFVENNQKLKILAAIPIGSYPKFTKIFFRKTRKWRYKNQDVYEPFFINLPFIKQYQRYRACKKFIQKNNDKNIFLYSIYPPFLKAISKLDSTYDITIMIPDLPKYADPSGGLVSQIKIKIKYLGINKWLRRIDNFVLLTEESARALNVTNKNYIVIEGICSNTNIMPFRNKAENETMNIFYAGSFYDKYGVRNLINAFCLTSNPKYRLLLCGNGEATSYIGQKAKIDPRIQYLGFLSHDQILELEAQSTLLINPRPNNDPMNKYSFPSKTMEYLASGTPILMYKLDGIPKEYDNYLYYINGNSIEDLKNAIESILKKPKKELSIFGKNAQNWVLANKNSKVQTKKILNFISNS